MQLTIAQQAVQLAARPAARRPRSAARRAACVRAQQGPSGAQSADVVDDNIGEYCTLDKSGKRPTKELTTAEKEQMFLEAMAAFYFDGETMLSDQEFDNLKSELQWEGSKVVVLSKDEQKFLEAKLSYKKGKPIMNDVEYEALKASLSGSGVFALRETGPTCSLDRPGVRGQKIQAALPDNYKMVALNAPAALVVVALVGGLDVVTGGSVAQLPGPIGAIFWGGVVLPFAFVVTNAITRALFKDAAVLRAPCPNCGEVNISYFGNIMSVEGPKETNVVKCPCCESQLEFNRPQSVVTVAEVGNSA